MKRALLSFMVATLFFIVACEKSVEEKRFITGADLRGEGIDNTNITSQSKPKPKYKFFNPGHVVSFWQKRQGAFAKYVNTNLPDSIEFIGCYISGTHVDGNVYFREERADISVDNEKEKFIPLSELSRDPRDTELWPQKMFNSFSSLEEGVMICAGTSRGPEKTKEIINQMSSDELTIENLEGIEINNALVRYYYNFIGKPISEEDVQRMASGR